VGVGRQGCKVSFLLKIEDELDLIVPPLSDRFVLARLIEGQSIGFASMDACVGRQAWPCMDGWMDGWLATAIDRLTHCGVAL
jgi:hypothetical protein